MHNETNPIDLMNLAGKAINSMADIQVSPGEKIAALRIAAFALEQAASAQNMAVMMANILQQTTPKA